MTWERALNLIVAASAAILVAVVTATGIASALSSGGGNARPAPAGPPRSTYTVHRVDGELDEETGKLVVRVPDSG